MKLSLIPILLAASAMAFAGDPCTASASINACVYLPCPISMSVKQNLSFGTLVIDPATFTKGSLRVDGNGAAIPNFGGGTALLTGSSHPAPKAAQFYVCGEKGYPFGFAAEEFTVQNLPDGTSWRVKPDIISTGILPFITTGNIGDPAVVNVGATLYIDNAVAGTWTGSMIAVVTYL